jgi:hypothetical protein
VYLGEQVLSFGEGRVALPLSIFWSYVSDTQSGDRSGVRLRKESP